MHGFHPSFPAPDHRVCVVQIVDEKIHRVYVVQSEEGPPRVQAVITPTDLLRLVAGVY
jgi:hypothetical protein